MLIAQTMIANLFTIISNIEDETTKDNVSLEMEKIKIG